MSKIAVKSCNGMIKMKGRVDVENKLNKNQDVFKIVKNEKNIFYRQCCKKRNENTKFCKSHFNKDVINKKNFLKTDGIKKITISELDEYFPQKQERKKKKKKKTDDEIKMELVVDIDNFKPDLNFKITQQLKDKFKLIISEISTEPDTEPEQKYDTVVKSDSNDNSDSNDDSDSGIEVLQITAKDGTNYVYEENTKLVRKLSEVNPKNEAINNIMGVLTVVSDKQASIEENGVYYIISYEKEISNIKYNVDKHTNRCYKLNSKSKLKYCGLGKNLDEYGHITEIELINKKEKKSKKDKKTKKTKKKNDKKISD